MENVEDKYVRFERLLGCHMERSLFPYLFKLLLQPLTFAEGLLLYHE